MARHAGHAVPPVSSALKRTEHPVFRAAKRAAFNDGQPRDAGFFLSMQPAPHVGDSCERHWNGIRFNEVYDAVICRILHHGGRDRHSQDVRSVTSCRGHIGQDFGLNAVQETPGQRPGVAVACDDLRQCIADGTVY